ncbi:hypothetical protein M1N55_06570 [Dehalococcoidia bacterium]|nr:hypothetical protein [Dehalococcoidia bacterium]
MISDNVKKLVFQRVKQTKGNSFPNDYYPVDEKNDIDTFVDRNVIGDGLLWASRQDENSSAKSEIENEAIRLFEINLQMVFSELDKKIKDEGENFSIDQNKEWHLMGYDFPAEKLRIVYSKRKDWVNCLRIVDLAIKIGDMFKSEKLEQMNSNWLVKREKIAKNL